ncbi:hypothetical protein [Leifsonia sp. TF02-11]|uniref:hypothetical protein n=1 Tax=Leifsonia sp. TF02-11 TaxID=2815212 RepID=UPI001AA11559|nr:hypothetical protein [Leifsonia sp. TF02-11]MBO1737389.1 hypothetical protein [Leifsonia sp. TF02-11]
MSDQSQPRSSGFVLVLVATGLVGVAGYVITWLVPRVIGVGAYAGFAVFWAALFLVIAALSGIQQETTRSSRTDPPMGPVPARASVFAVGAGLLVLIVIPLSAPLWVGAVFSGDWALVWPLALGSASYVPLAVITGTLYSRRAWKAIFLVVVTEGLLRLVLIGAVLLVTSAIVPLAWAAAVPTPIAAAVGLVAVRRGAASTFLDAGYRRLSWNATRTIVAAASMGLLVSGFPTLLTATSPEASSQQLGLVILAATLVRAPLIVVAMAAQSFLIVLFRGAGDRLFRLFVMLEVAVIAAGAVLGTVAWLIGPPVFEFLFPGTTAPSGWLLGAFVGTAGILAGMCVSAPAVLVLGRHSIFTAGWLVAALGTTGALLLPLPIDQRAALALLIGPMAGLLVHTVYLVGARPSATTEIAVR